MNDDQFVDDIRATLRSAGTRTVADPELVGRLTSTARLARHDPPPPRTIRAWSGPVLVAASVVAVLGLTVLGLTAAPALTGHHHATHGAPAASGLVPRPATSPAGPPSQHPTTAGPPSSPSTSASRPSSQHSANVPTPGTGSWASPTLTITDSSLGAVTRGMTRAQVEAAAGVPLTMIGDGIYQPVDDSRTGGTTLRTAWGFTCFDATNDSGRAGTAVVTPAGVRLGDPMSVVAARYGSAAGPYRPDPSWTGPGNVPGGIMVTTPTGVLLFIGSSADHRGGTIVTIRGSYDIYHASSGFC